MIFDKILDFLFYLPLLLLNSLPAIDFSIPDNVFNGMETLVCNIGYALPVQALLPILISSFSLSFFKITWSLFIRIKSFVPTMGD